MIIGITGGSGCGKTTLLHQIQRCGGMVLDCDALYHELLASDHSLLNTIEQRFPGTVINGILQRKKLGDIVFSDSEALQDLNRITHGAVRQEIEHRLTGNPKLAAIDAIALFEGNLANLCDITVAVTAPTEERIKRLLGRDGITEEYARKRISAQPSDDWFQQKCDYVLENDADLEAFEAKCVAFLRHIGIMKA